MSSSADTLTAVTPTGFFTSSLAQTDPEIAGRIGKELGRQRDDALHQVGLNESPADVALAAGIGTHGTVGEQQRHRAIGCEVVEHVLHPRKVGVAIGRNTVFPTNILG